ncbi:MAG TPA: nuclear transport factor 2 family protein [Acidimicrobiales bacterium]|nr:nuclear transport factor 2 family protein [Acidimicrobiales bacterium]
MTDTATALGNLIARYAELIDEGDFDGVADLLGEAAVGQGDSPSLLTGRDALADLFKSTTRRYPDGTPRTKHVTTNLIFEIDEEAGTAAARSYWTVLQAVDGLPLQPILAGRYHDRFERDGPAWHFSERRYLIDLVGDVSRHMLANVPS